MRMYASAEAHSSIEKSAAAEGIWLHVDAARPSNDSPGGCAGLRKNEGRSKGRHDVSRAGRTT
jgi:hypothetical protein